MMLMVMLMYCCSVGRTDRQESTVRSRRNPISKPMRRQSGKTRISHSSKASTCQHDVPAESVADSEIASPVMAEHSISRKANSSLGDVDTGFDVGEMFQPALAERVKLRRMSQPSSDSSDADRSEYGSKSQLGQSEAEKAPSATTKNLPKHAVTEAGKKPSRIPAIGSAKKEPRTVKLALTKKTTASRRAVSSSKSESKSVRSDAKRSVQKQKANSSVMAASGTTTGTQKQPSKKLAAQKSKPLKSTVSKSGSVAASRLSPKCTAADAKQSKRSCNVTKEPANKSADDAAKMPQLKANSKKDVAVVEVKSMPVLQQEKSPAASNQSAKKSSRKRQKPTPTKVQPKSPKLSPGDETSHAACKRSLRNNDVKAETSFGDDDMPQLLAVEVPSDSKKSLTVAVDQSECPPELDRSLLCAAGEANSTEQKSGCQSPTAAQCQRENKDLVVKTSPRSVSAKDGEASKVTTPKQPPARACEQHATPVSNCTALSLYHCSISSPLAGTVQAVCSMSSRIAVTQQTECSLSGSQTKCNISTPQPHMTPLKQNVVSVSDTHPKDKCLSGTASTEPSTELVPYTSQQLSSVSTSGQWQLPCGVPMAPFIITGMYPMLGSGGYGCQFMSLPPFVSPGMPAATSIMSAGSPPLQYSGYHLPRPATAAPVVPLYMSPIVSPPPFVQPSLTSSQVNLLPFMSSLPHAAVQNQSSSTTLILRPSMPAPPPPDHMYCMLPTQQQVNLPLSAHQSFGRLVHVHRFMFTACRFLFVCIMLFTALMC